MIKNFTQKAFLQKYYDYFFSVALAAYFLVLPWQTRWIARPEIADGFFLEYGTISLYLSDMAAAAVIFLYFIKKRRPGQPSSLALLWFLSGLDFFIFLSALLAPDKAFAFLSYGRFLLAVGVFWVIKSIRLKPILYFCLGLSLAASFVLAIFQFNFQATWPSSVLGLAAHQAEIPGQSIVEASGAGRFLRAYGSFDHPNMLGGAAAITLLFSLLFYLKSGRLSLFKSALLVFSGWAVLVSWSRAAWLALIASLGFLLLINFWQKRYLEQKKILLAVLAVGSILFVLSALYGDLLDARSGIKGQSEARSVSERVDQYGEGKELIKNHWLLGVGINSYVLKLIEVYPARPVWDYRPLHNVFLLIWGEIGIFGLVFFVSIVSYLAQVLINRKNYNYLPVLVMLTVLMMFDHWLWDLHLGIFGFWTVLGILYSESNS